MKIRFARFNINLLLCATALLLGCQTTEQKKLSKEATTMRFHLQTGRDASHSGVVAVYRANPVRLNVEREPFLTEVDMESASVVDVRGGYAIQIQFNGHAALVLEGVTVAHKGQHVAIESNFGEVRWLAAPVLTRRISNGQFVFTPDASRDETERIVRGLNNLIAKVKKKTSSWLD